MKPTDYDFPQYTKSPSLREHLEVIQSHAEAACRISGNQSSNVTGFQFTPGIPVELQPNIASGGWQSGMPKSFGKTEYQCSLNGHLSQIKCHAQSALGML